MTEFVNVTYPQRRGVLIDGGANGFTNQLLQIDAGFHSFALAGRADYAPLTIDHIVAGTSVQRPLILQFLPVAATAIVTATTAVPGEAPVRARRVSARKRKPTAKKGGAKKSTAKKAAAKAPASKKPARTRAASEKQSASKRTSRKSSKKTTSRKGERK